MAMIAEPGVAPNNNFRFSRAGAVTQVVLDGSYYFCASEPHHLAHPSSGGCGLMNEFLFDVSNEAKDGEYFPKIGIGLLRKDKEGYAMYRRYDPEEVQLFPITFECSENTIVFEIQPLPCMRSGKPGKLSLLTTRSGCMIRFSMWGRRVSPPKSTATIS